MDIQRQDSLAASAVMSPGFLWLLLAIAAGLAFFAPGLAYLWQEWQTPEYSHGPLIPLISGYLFLRQLKTVPAHTGVVSDRWPGAVLMGVGLLIGAAGILGRIDQVIAYGLILWVGGLVLTSFGWKRGRGLWPPVVHLAFMLPLPGLFYWKVSIALQFISSELGVAIIRLMDISVFLDGNIIDLGVWKLHVAEACSGLRYLFPIMSFTYIFAVLYQGPIWIRAVLLLAAIPIAVVMNSIRIGFIGVIVNSYGIEHAEGFMHFFEGWVVFLLCILAMIGLARAMQRLSGDRRSFAEVLDLDLSGLGEMAARVRDIRPSGALVGMSVVFAVATIVMHSPLVRPTPPEIEREPFALFPRALGPEGEWRGTLRPDLSPAIAEILKADDYFSAGYVRPGAAAPVDLFIAWYRDQTKGGIHSPEICIPGSGWEMSAITQTEIMVETGSQSMMIPVNRAIIQKGLERQLVYFWFELSGRRLTSDYAAKAWLVWDALRHGRTDGALVRLITPMPAGEPEVDADARLSEMIGVAMPQLDRFIEMSRE
jgi:exosortase D (VPLPA-CTERM-specific)